MINAAAALKFCLVFLLCFWLAGFTAIQSIFLGILAGWTGGLLSKWWSIKTIIDEEIKPGPWLRPVTMVSQFFSSRTVGRTSAERHSGKPKGSMGWFGLMGPPKRRR
ncbi:MAG: hypothetical protein WBA10_15125 [Elainellaceae cyanobacterium]